MANYEWFRYLELPLSNGSNAILSDVNDPFAVYMDDFFFGVRITTDTFPTTGYVNNSWRIQIRRDDLSVFDAEWRFRRIGGNETLETVLYDETGTPIGDPVDRSEVLGNTATGQLILDTTYPPGTAINQYSAEFIEDTFPGTTLVYFVNHLEEGTDPPVTEGGIDDIAGELGVGFDIRLLAVKNFTVIKEKTDILDPYDNKINFKGDFYALPAYTDLHPFQWC